MFSFWLLLLLTAQRETLFLFISLTLYGPNSFFGRFSGHNLIIFLIIHS